MILVAVASRILPHPPNFNPLMAVSLFSGAYLLEKKWAYFVPLAAMLISDLYFGLHDLLPVVYICMAGIVFLGTKLSQNKTWKKTFGYTLFSSVVFFLVTNFAVWLTSGMYPLNGEGLVTCFTLAVPFFQNSVAGDLLFTGILFGSMAFLERTHFKGELVKVKSN